MDTPQLGQLDQIEENQNRAEIKKTAIDLDLHNQIRVLQEHQIKDRERGEATAQKIAAVEADLKENNALTSKNNALTEKVSSDMALVIEILEYIKSAVRVLGGIGTAVKWLGPVVAGAAAIWAVVNGKTPKV